MALKTFGKEATSLAPREVQYAFVKTCLCPRRVLPLKLPYIEKNIFTIKIKAQWGFNK